jgi:hypothetical protein
MSKEPGSEGGIPSPSYESWAAQVHKGGIMSKEPGSEGGTPSPSYESWAAQVHKGGIMSKEPGSEGEPLPRLMNPGEPRFIKEE